MKGKGVFVLLLAVFCVNAVGESHGEGRGESSARPSIEQCKLIGEVTCEKENLGTVQSPKFRCESISFSVEGPTKEIAAKVAIASELAWCKNSIYWSGRRFRAVDPRAKIKVFVTAFAGAGRTQYSFVTRVNSDGEVVSTEPPTDFKMTLRGDENSLLNDLVPHEVNHMVMATLFEREIPLWANEGASVNQESRFQREIRKASLKESLRDGFPSLVELLEQTKYPEGEKENHRFYTLSFSLSEFLIQQPGGKTKFVDLINERLSGKSWTAAFRHSYGYEGLKEVEESWHRSLGTGSSSRMASNR